MQLLLIFVQVFEVYQSEIKLITRSVNCFVITFNRTFGKQAFFMDNLGIIVTTRESKFYFFLYFD